MSNPELTGFRDAYYDIREVVAPFVSPWWNNLAEGLTEEDAQSEFYYIYDDLADDGYTPKEIRFLTAIAICDIQKEMQEDIDDYETKA